MLSSENGVVFAAMEQTKPRLFRKMMSSGNGHTAKADEILSMPAISQTPAGELGAFALVNSAALGFGPRTPGLVSELRAKILAEITQ